jgi:hypothetical protein
MPRHQRYVTLEQITADRHGDSGRRSHHQGLKLGQGRTDQCGEKIVLGTEVVVQRGLGEAEPLGQLAGRSGRETVLSEQLQRDVEDSAACVVSRAGARRGLRHGRGR